MREGRWKGEKVGEYRQNNTDTGEIIVQRTHTTAEGEGSMKEGMGMACA